MCGIVFVAGWHEATTSRCNCQDDAYVDFLDHLRAANAARGPDAQCRHQTTLKGVGGGIVHLDFFASELRLRGDAPVTQPHVKESGDVLCWNGEIFEGLDVRPDENDGARLSGALSGLDDASDVVRLLGTLEGPYAFVYYHHLSRKLFFARDPLGRRSLLVHWPTNKSPHLLLASVSIGTSNDFDFTDLSTEHIYALDLDGLSGETAMSLDPCLERLQRLALGDNDSARVPFARPERVNRALPPIETKPPPLQSLDSIPRYLLSAMEDLISHLDRSVALRVSNIPRRSGESPSIDNMRPVSSVSARIAVFFSGGIDSTVCAFLADRHIPPDEPIDLLNVAFENPRKIRIQVDGNVGGIKKKKLKSLPDIWSAEGQASGRYGPNYLVPDRSAGLSELEELRRLCPGRQWNFVEIDVPYSEYQAAQPTVKSLMWPCHTVMDLSLAMALYFAARGIGKLRSGPDAQPEPYTSPARVILNGLGSDELLGGYGRHRTAFNTGGWPAVIDELQLEMDRIPTRNLGRDDRVISAHGKETRHPFLSLGVVNFLVGLPVHLKLDPRLELGVGDKMLLRLAARKMGLVEASARKKRAMQFGTHAARMEVGVADGGGTLPVL
ncbi:asparagine synthase-domain-containing protein [Russula earlei]|uniref:Asparagine synthase-domain-containing protein n=1 Tax=Russula earlei TaxID=71964 RepID=A0ACC0ULS4_9AGAM|nr:asparagine synthase-domain-containing protein [Russula earlei]